jgi:CspA family cold shock protein
MISGKVKWFSDAKGYGFIDLGQGRDIFVHYSVIDNEGYKSLREGQEVEYEVGQGPKGDHATKVVAKEALPAA